MGCFSFLCKECGKGIQSNSFAGQRCHLFLLKKGEVIQSMSGEYDSYGRVFIDNTQDSSIDHSLRLSEKWKQVEPFNKYDLERIKIVGKDQAIWSQVCGLMHNEDDNSNGIAAVHAKCYDGKKKYNTRSESDPNQGWGEDMELFSSTNSEEID